MSPPQEREEHWTNFVAAVPVAPASGCNAIQREADELISVVKPEQFLAVSQWYQDFSQVSDEDVQRLLESAIDLIPLAASRFGANAERRG